ncbi:hypothetical protein ABZZ20_35655 [Streptomyces sp. NPDC006430]|uniref:hypothetical protein n=1 Tax=Streptomyces sp. NPDC006430 TaxID=3154299 RepID=UPI0033BD5A0E
MHSRTIAVTSLGTTALLALTACAPVGGAKAADMGRAARAGAAPSGGPKPAAPAKGTGMLTDLSGAEILSQSQETMSKTESFRIVAKIPYDGKPAALDMAVDKKGNCNGTVRAQDMGTVHLIKSPDLVHFKGDADYWRGAAQKDHLSQKQTGQLVTSFADRWMKIPASDPRAKKMAAGCALGKSMDKSEKPSPLARKGEVTTIDGQQAVAIVSPSKEGTETDYVAARGKPYLLKSTVSGDMNAEAAFSAFDTPVDVTSPTDSDVLDLSKLGGGVPAESV